jgi:flagellar biosynthesis protein FliR
MTLGLPISTVFAFVLVLARVGGLIAFLPLPGFRAASDPARAFLSVVITFALFPVWPSLPNTIPTIGQLILWAVTETGFGMAAGLTISFVTDAFQLAMQILGLQAGFGYASTIDPTSQVDAGLLQVLCMLITGLLAFAIGLDRVLLRILATSLERFPAGTWTPSLRSIDGVLHAGSEMFSLGLRVAMPVVAVLLFIDVALALLGRIQQQLQLLSLAFPVKMLAALMLLAMLAPVFARLFEQASTRALTNLWEVAAGH